MLVYGAHGFRLAAGSRGDTGRSGEPEVIAVGPRPPSPREQRIDPYRLGTGGSSPSGLPRDACRGRRPAECGQGTGRRPKAGKAKPPGGAFVAALGGSEPGPPRGPDTGARPPALRAGGHARRSGPHHAPTVDARHHADPRPTGPSLGIPASCATGDVVVGWSAAFGRGWGSGAGQRWRASQPRGAGLSHGRWRSLAAGPSRVGEKRSAWRLRISRLGLRPPLDRPPVVVTPARRVVYGAHGFRIAAVREAIGVDAPNPRS
jgi:hypothetical protein